MRRSLKLALALIIGIYLCGISAAREPAFGAQALGEKDLVASARAIVTGKVIRIESRWDANRNNIYTDITVALSQVLKGDIKTEEIVIEQLGGRLRGRQSWLVGSPQFTLGEEVLLYLNTNREGVLHTAQLGMGKFSISGGKTIARDSAIKAGADLYIDRVKELLIEESARIKYYDRMYGTEIKTAPVDYLPGSGELQSSFNPFEDDFKVLNSRFFEPDSDQPVTFVVNPANAPVSGGATTQVNRAIDAWNGAGSRLRLVNGGASTLCGFNKDQRSVISFGDCDSVLDDPVDGKGMIGAVMIVSGTDFRIISGNRFSQTMEADIVFNNGFDNLLSVPSNLEELITHFLGNAFGLDNSSDSASEADPIVRESIMFFMPHFDGRGARLNSDDMSGAVSIYPFFRSVQFTGDLIRPVINVPLRQQLTATFGFPPYTFAVTRGTLPENFTLLPSGLLSGTPGKVETANFTITVTDSANFRSSRDFTLTVATIEPKVLSVSQTRVCYNGDTDLTITGTGFSGTSAVTLSSGTVQGFQVISDTTIRARVRGPGTTNLVSNLTITNPNSSSTLTGAFLFAGPVLRGAMIGIVTRKNKSGNLVMPRAVIIDGDGLTFTQKLAVNGTFTNLPADRDINDRFIFYGKVGKEIPKKGSFKLRVFDIDLGNCGSNEITVTR
jgi:hypothetical protein